MNIALVDDQEADRIHLERILQKYDSIHQLGIDCSHFADGKDLLKDYRPFMYTVVFLDIYMDGISGIEAARRIREVDDSTDIVFTTTSEVYRPDAFSLFATSYIIKPCTQEQVFRLLDHIFRLRTGSKEFFSFSFDRHDFSLPYEDIASLITDGNYLSIKDRTGRSYRTRMTFSEATERLDSRFLILVKGIADNIDMIAQIKDEHCRMQDGSVLPLNVKRQTLLREQWLNYKFTKIREDTVNMEVI
ncbi:MAG: response regulator transcription factor [Lachnospiraceae bacterium]|nr:response regulator transcription factor [Lachnospiraceae bacterium]